MVMNEKINIKGKLKIEVITPDGSIKQTVTTPNTIVTAGKNLVATLVGGTGTEFTHMAIGTSSTAVAAGNTTLGTETGRVTLTSKAVTDNDIAYIGDFPAGTGTGSIVEAGILNASSAGTMLNRATFSAITKSASDALKITWTVSFG
tara:strand:+ start:987 stop:1427 length:441 start_codon:yes stop_codon:yes gene_type:complete